MTKFKDVRGFAFDMDGILADTARFHTIAWRQIADEVGTTWTVELEEGLKGIDRMGSLALILETGGYASDYNEQSRLALAQKKNHHYRELISTLTSDDILPGMANLLTELKQAGYKMSVASASKNAPFIIERLGLMHYFDGIVDPASVPVGKPDPAIFTAAATILDLDPKQVIGLEDSAAGVKSINAAGELSIGVGDPMILQEADIQFNQTEDVTLIAIKQHIES